MNSSFTDRALTILADGGPVSGWVRARLTGRETISLCPFPFTLRLWNLSEDAYLRLARSGMLEIRHRGAVLAAGKVSDAFRRPTRDGTETEVSFSPGLALWEADAVLSAEAGMTASETVRALLEASGAGVSLLAFPGPDPVFARAQAYAGRAAECVEEALSAAGARGCLVPSGLCVVPREGLPFSLVLTEEDLADSPSFAAGGQLVLRTAAAGWTVGKAAEVRCGGLVYRGLIEERSLDLNTGPGPWRCELLMRRMG